MILIKATIKTYQSRGVSDFLFAFCCFINIKGIVLLKISNCHNLLSQVLLNSNKFISSVENKSYLEECG